MYTTTTINWLNAIHAQHKKTAKLLKTDQAAQSSISLIINNQLLKI